MVNSRQLTRHTWVVTASPHRQPSVLFTTATTGFYGSTKVMVRHAAALMAEGSKVSVALDSRLIRPGESARLLDELRVMGAAVHQIEGLTSWRALLPFGSVARSFRSIDADVVVSTQVRDAAASALLSSHADVLFVALVQNHPRFSGRRPTAWVKWRLYRLALRSADRVVCVAEHVASIVQSELGVDRNRVGIVANLVDVAERNASASNRTALRSSLSVASDQVLAVNVARIHPQKGQLDLIDALAEVGDPSLVVALVGGIEAHGAADYRRRIEQRAETLGVADQLRWLGFRDDVPSFLDAADFFVSASRWEAGPSLAVLEAMSAECALLATDHGERLEGFTDGEHGIYVPAGNPHALAGGLRQMLAFSQAERNAMGMAARALVERRTRRLAGTSSFSDQLSIVLQRI